MRADLKTIALEFAPFTAAVVAGQMVRAMVRREPFGRAAALLRAWRTADYGPVVHRASGYLKNLLLRDGRVVSLGENAILRSFVASPQAEAIRREFAAYGIQHRVRMRYPREDDDPARQGDLIVLKAPDEASGEKGVLLVKYTEALARFAALFEVEHLVDRYTLVLEPSSWGYQDSLLFLYVGSDADVVVQAPSGADFRFVAGHGFGLVPTRLGAGDWIDPDLFSPSGAPKTFDVVMVSAWSPVKRHIDLLNALEEAKEKHGRTLKAALVGVRREWTADHIRKMIEDRDLSDQCTIFDSVPQTRVAEIVSQARLYLLLSRREGANKAMYEALFCDTPVLAPGDHRGINHKHLDGHTGMAFERGHLTDALLTALDRAASYSPRRWALENTGYRNATRTLNGLLADVARKRGLPWSGEIVEKKNQPNLRYASEKDRLALEGAYDRLQQYLRPVLQ